MNEFSLEKLAMSALAFPRMCSPKKNKLARNHRRITNTNSHERKYTLKKSKID